MFKGLLQLVVLAILTYTATADDDKPKVWSGNLQFSEEGFLKDDDVRRIQKEIQVISRYFQQFYQLGSRLQVGIILHKNDVCISYSFIWVSTDTLECIF